MKGSLEDDVIKSSETGRLMVCDSFSQLMMLLPSPCFSACRAERSSASSQNVLSLAIFPPAFFFVIKTSNRRRGIRTRYALAEVQSHGVGEEG